ncbi:MAG: maleylpyruvate isomerase N-terminal domain-containing protein [Acidimicrobiales bacterium]
MDHHRHLELLVAEGGRLAATPADALAAPVPTVPGWTVLDVLRHTGKVHRWVCGMLDAGPDGAPPTDLVGLPKGPDCLPAYREALDAVVARLGDHEPDQPVLTFAGVQPASFWFRRQAHEVTVHRVDVADALAAEGGPAPLPVEADVAADGIDEWARFFLAVRWNQRNGPFPAELTGRTIHIHGTDDPAPADGAEWLLTFGEGTVAVEATHAKGDVALRGSAEDLLLALWRRRPLDTVDVLGDHDLATHLLDLARF